MLDHAKRISRRRGVFALGAVAISGCTLLFPVHEGPSSDANGFDGATSEASDGPRPSYRDEVLADGPSMYLRFGEKSGTKAVDELHRLDGTYPGGGVTYGVPGAIAGDTDTAIAFDGTARVTIPPGLDFAGTAAFSVELWAKQTAYLEYGPTVDHGSYPAAGGKEGWTLRLGSDSFGLERWVAGDTAGSIALSPAPLPLGAYHHVVATFDGGAIRLYRDGALVGTPGVSNLSLKSMNGTWAIGAQNCACTGEAFIGSLDEVAIYQKVLSVDRIAAHFRAGSGT